MKGPDRQIWYAVTFDGRAPGQDGRLNYAGYNPDRAYAVEEAVEKALQQGTDMSRMRVWHHTVITAETDWTDVTDDIDDTPAVQAVLAELHHSHTPGTGPG